MVAGEEATESAGVTRACFALSTVRPERARPDGVATAIGLIHSPATSRPLDLPHVFLANRLGDLAVTTKQLAHDELPFGD